MKVADEAVILSASDLANHLACEHRTHLDLRAAHGLLRPPFFHDAALELLMERGRIHEATYVELLRSRGVDVVRIADGPGDAVAQTMAAMAHGTGAIVQGELQDGGLRGRTDVLLRVERGGRWPWSYEVVDTKLARETKATTIVQLMAYSRLLHAAQHVLPELLHVVSPAEPLRVESFAVRHFMAVVARLHGHANDLVTTGATVPLHTYPEPVAHCAVCRWWPRCQDQRRADDHLSLVANITRNQRRELVSQGVMTTTNLATGTLTRPSRGSLEGLRRAQHQAALQVESRGLAVPKHAVLPVVPGEGLLRLPAPSPGDVFLDLEGDPFVGQQGREYLLGWVHAGDDGKWRYEHLWAFTDEGEKHAYNALMDALTAAHARHPDMHVYHYAPYEPAALKRLMGRHALRADALDNLLRHERFVDLYAVVRQAVRVGVERYSIKGLEPLYGFTRQMPLADVTPAKGGLERLLEAGVTQDLPTTLLDTVRLYNADDCHSARALRDWLEGVRAGLLRAGLAMPRPPDKAAEPESVELSARLRRIAELRGRLHAGLPATNETRNEAQQAKWMLGHLLEFHRREEKVSWWEYYRLKELPEEELVDERDALGGLTLVRSVSPRGRKKARTYVFRFPPQETDLRVGDKVEGAGDVKGVLTALDVATLEAHVESTADLSATTGLFTHDVVPAGAIDEALQRLAECLLGGRAQELLLASLEMLRGAPPGLRRGSLAALPGEDGQTTACRVLDALDSSVLPIQGPPGTGKTHTAAHMIVHAVATGKRVGVTATSHAVIMNLMERVRTVATERAVDVRCGHKGDKDAEPRAGIALYTDNDRAEEALRNREVAVLGGTPWLWARPELAHSVDVLFVDEAGQVSLAKALAAAQAATNVVLLGDPRQLEQPLKAAHPDGTEVSVLDHLLRGQPTMPPDRGLFLGETRRLAPAICAFTSEMFYEGRLRSQPGLERQQLIRTGFMDGTGLWFLPVHHDGCVNQSVDEADAVATVVERLLRAGFWVDAQMEVRAITESDVLVVAPYNAQVNLLSDRLGKRARVGTVDKFQGQEAPVVIYSMTTSRPEDAPRGLEFLYSLSRLNVATSRARCACVLIASPRLLTPECRTPRQLRLANALVDYEQRARVLDPA